jgi:hypothetical protein
MRYIVSYTYLDLQNEIVNGTYNVGACSVEDAVDEFYRETRWGRRYVTVTGVVLA